jgi:hypothetical protein
METASVMDQMSTNLKETLLSPVHHAHLEQHLIQEIQPNVTALLDKLITKIDKLANALTRVLDRPPSHLHSDVKHVQLEQLLMQEIQPNVIPFVQLTKFMI